MALNRNISKFALIALLLGCVRAPASETLDQLIGEAQANNPELNYYRAEIKAARGERRTAGEWANPEVTTDAGAKIVNDSNGNSLGQGASWSRTRFTSKSDSESANIRG